MEECPSTALLIFRRSFQLASCASCRYSSILCSLSFLRRLRSDYHNSLNTANQVSPCGSSDYGSSSSILFGNLTIWRAVMESTAKSPANDYSFRYKSSFALLYQLRDLSFYSDPFILRQMCHHYTKIIQTMAAVDIGFFWREYCVVLTGKCSFRFGHQGVVHLMDQCSCFYAIQKKPPCLYQTRLGICLFQASSLSVLEASFSFIQYRTVLGTYLTVCARLEVLSVDLQTVVNPGDCYFQR